MTIDAIVQKHWERQKVKFETKPFKWVKTLRTADCAFCKKHEREKEIDLGFSSWAILTHVASIEGKAPEVCTNCLPKIGIKMTVRSPRIALCLKCGCHQKEKIYGIGWPGWSPLPSIAIIGQKRDTPQLCPNCSLKLARKLGKEFVRGTWTSLTYAASSLLTSTKMTQNQANFAALAAGDSGAPDIANLQSGLDAGKPETPIVGDVYVATDTEKLYACYSAGTWSEIGVGVADFYNRALVISYWEALESIKTYATGTGAVTQYAEGEYLLVTTGTSNNDRTFVKISRYPFTIFDKNIDAQFVIKPDTLTDCNFCCGLNTGFYDTTYKHVGIYYESGQLKASCADGTTRSTEDISGVDASLWHRYKIHYEAGSKALFYVDGVLKATITTNLPSDSTQYGSLMMEVQTLTTAAKILYASLVVAEQDW